MTMPRPTEHEEQVKLFAELHRLSARYPAAGLAYAIPNGGHRHKATAGRLRAEGVRSGVPDLCIPAPRGPHHGLYIEMKRQGAPPSAVRPEQREWLAALADEGYRAEVCRGCREALDTVLDYLSQPKPAP